MKRVYQTGTLLTLIGVLLLSVTGALASTSDFPLRKDFPDLTPISTSALAQKYTDGDVIVVDVRSRFEYETIHVKDAQHLSLAKKSFLTDLERIRSKSDSKLLAFYCNGTTCAKSYRAALKAQDAGFTNCVVYDAGIFNWTQTHPEWAALLNKTPADPAKLISKSAIKEKMLPAGAFQSEAKSPDTLVIDIRDPIQRSVRVVFDGQRYVPLDRFKGFLSKRGLKDKKLLIFDAVGKQVRWLMYHLEDHGYSDYAFLKGGAREALGGKRHY